MIAPIASPPAVPARIFRDAPRPGAAEVRREYARVADHAAAELVRDQPAFRTLEKRRFQHGLDFRDALLAADCVMDIAPDALWSDLWSSSAISSWSCLMRNLREQNDQRVLHRKGAVSRKSDHTMELFNIPGRRSAV